MPEQVCGVEIYKLLEDLVVKLANKSENLANIAGQFALDSLKSNDVKKREDALIAEAEVKAYRDACDMIRQVMGHCVHMGYIRDE
jgi:hypothetical protein